MESHVAGWTTACSKKIIARYPAIPNGEKYVITAMIMMTTTTDHATSEAVQLARLAALSSATVVANVSPFTFSSDGAGVIKLTTTNTIILKKNNQMQKYKKFIVAN